MEWNWDHFLRFRHCPLSYIYCSNKICIRYDMKVYVSNQKNRAITFFVTYKVLCRYVQRTKEYKNWSTSHAKNNTVIAATIICNKNLLI